jgi:hypothetical protein
MSLLLRGGGPFLKSRRQTGAQRIPPLLFKKSLLLFYIISM